MPNAVFLGHARRFCARTPFLLETRDSKRFLVSGAANAEVLQTYGKNSDNDPNKQLRIGGVGMTSVQGTGQTGVRTSAFKKGVLGNEKSATKFARPGMDDVSISLIVTLCTDNI